mgnify:CR=1 FL=1
MWTLMCQQNQIELYSEKKEKSLFSEKKGSYSTKKRLLQ